MIRLFGQLDERAVGQGVLTNELRGIRLIVVFAEERHFDLRRVVDHVVIGEDEAILAADDEARSGGDRRLLLRARSPAALIALSLASLSLAAASLAAASLAAARRRLVL